MNMKGLGVLMCLVLCARPAAAQVFATVGASTRGGDVAHNGLGVASSDYQATVNGRVEQAHAQSITSGGAQPMADTQGFGDFTQAGGSGQVFYTFSVAGPGLIPCRSSFGRPSMRIHTAKRRPQPISTGSTTCGRTAG